MRLKIIISFCFVIIAFHVSSQTKYWVYFTDKDCGNYSLEQPSNFLSQEAINRRKRQNIPIATNDLPVCNQYAEELTKVTNSAIQNHSRWLNAVSINATSTQLEKVSELSYVLKIEKVKTYSRAEEELNLESSGEAKNPYHPIVERNGFCFDYGEAFSQVTLMNADFLHNYGYTGSGMSIAVFDGGFIGTDSHEVFTQLRQEGRILGTKDFVDGDNEVYQSSGHGTQVLSCMASFHEGLLVGTAPAAGYYLFKTEDVSAEYLMEEDNWVAAAEYADSIGVDIINSSLGYTTFDDTLQNHTYSDMDGNTTIITKGADIAASKGILVCNSAGNSGNNSWFYIGAPADGDSVFTIGAVNSSGDYVGFSSKGPSFDGRIKPNVAAQGGGVRVVSPEGGIFFGSGTSFSCPLLAGAAACLWQVDTTLTNMQLMQIIEESSDQINKPDSLKGYGVPDFKLAYQNITGNKGFGFSGNDSLKVYPNPVTDWLNIDYFSTDTFNLTINLYDITGKEILVDNQFVSCERTILGIYVAGWLSSGVYFLSIGDGDKQLNFKFIKN